MPAVSDQDRLRPLAARAALFEALEEQLRIEGRWDDPVAVELVMATVVRALVALLERLHGDDWPLLVLAGRVEREDRRP